MSYARTMTAYRFFSYYLNQLPQAPVMQRQCPLWRVFHFRFFHTVFYSAVRNARHDINVHFVDDYHPLYGCFCFVDLANYKE